MLLVGQHLGAGAGELAAVAVVAVVRCVEAVEHAVDALQLQRLGGVYRAHAAVGNGAENHGDVGHVGQGEVARVVGPPCDLALGVVNGTASSDHIHHCFPPHLQLSGPTGLRS